LSAGWPPREVFAELAAKYAEIARLRAERAAGAPVAPRTVLKSLAARFPGSLRELDTLEEREIDDRRAALERAAAGGPVEPWMIWLAAYHHLFRIGLGAGPIEGDATSPFGEAALHLLRNPPHGRRTDAVLLIIAQTFGSHPAIVGKTLIPRRRAR